MEEAERERYRQWYAQQQGDSAGNNHPPPLPPPVPVPQPQLSRPQLVSHHSHPQAYSSHSQHQQQQQWIPSLHNEQQRSFPHASSSSSSQTQQFPPSSSSLPHQTHQLQYRRRLPAHPDDFPPSYPSFLDYQYQSSPEISPLTQTTYPLYPAPSFSQHPSSNGPSPTNSVGATPSPYTTPGGTIVPLPPMNPFSPYQQVTTHDMMFNAVESARWMATTSGPYEDPNRHLQQQQHQYPTLLRPVATRPPSAPPPPIAAPLSTIAAITTEDMDRRASDTSVISETSSNAGSVGQGVSASMSFGFPQTEDRTGDEEAGPNALVKPFIEKLYNILSRPSTYGDVIKWSDAGDAFFVAHTDKLTSDVLPEHFSHSNIHSFTRQLNVYNFTRMSVKQLRDGLSIPGATTAEYSGWSHPQFQKGEVAKLALLAPRPSRARLLKKLEKQYGGGASMSSSNAGSGSGGSGSDRRGSGGGGREGNSSAGSNGSMGRIDEYG